MEISTNRRTLITASAMGAMAAVFKGFPAVNAFAAGEDPLPSWNAGAAKESIISFVTAITDPEHPRFVPVEDRFAAFDLDGTLWVEKPTYVDLAFAEARGRERIELDPELAQMDPWKSLVELDEGTRSSLPEDAVTGLVVDAFHGESPDTFQFFAREWLNASVNPVLGRRNLDLSYLPMQELLAYLRANEFEIAMASAGDIEFLRVHAEPLFGIPMEFTIGTQVALEVQTNGNDAELVRGNTIVFGVWGDNKPIGIRVHTGRRPILAFGNTSGDIPMLLNAMQDGEGLALMLAHDDAEREFAYGNDPSGPDAIEKLEEQGIIVVSMKHDFATIFSEEPGPDLLAES